MTRWRRLRRRSRELLAGFEVPQPFSVEALCARVSAHRGRDLHLHPLPYTGAADLPCGLWVSTAGADHIFHARGASALHQQNIILHEIGHMLCDHTLANGDNGLLALLGDLDPAMVRRVLMRTRYSTPEEQEAEMVAALIREQAGWSAVPARPDGVLGVIDEVFGLPGNR
ncbi:hypothetical protein SAMN05216188_108183 [Lentzea xinjiangensis]|uniref:IrrE N-terminal-like domain-containing protein n=1 Tax=Lentzea xinjiangensis TaxID=402600 RepID=A0A1H9M036_9PSEU|nr:hypothetical protein [Lentzea xinjiangensis]SER16949.1 hypothetical protein SAMN05216188_108183 [Lentzea xinjiangensis]